MEHAPLAKDKKVQLVKEVTESVARVTGLPAQTIFVFIKENSLENIGAGDRLLADKDKE